MSLHANYKELSFKRITNAIFKRQYLRSTLKIMKTANDFKNGKNRKENCEILN